jgi:hypothetical protein
MASNQIPTYATAVLDLRLVLGNDWKRQQQKVIDHIKAQGYYITNNEPTDEERKKYAKIIKVIPAWMALMHSAHPWICPSYKK